MFFRVLLGQVYLCRHAFGGTMRFEVALPIFVDARVDRLLRVGALRVCRSAPRPRASVFRRHGGFALHGRCSRGRAAGQRGLVGQDGLRSPGRFAYEYLGGHRLAALAQRLLPHLPVGVFAARGGGALLAAPVALGQRPPVAARRRALAVARQSGGVES